MGIIPHMIAAITGLAALLHASAIAFETVKWLGVAYLLYLAWQTWRDTSTMSVDERLAPRSALRTIRSAVLINVLNPKLTIFFFAFLPQFVNEGAHDGVFQMLQLSLVFMAVTLVVFAVAVRNQIISRPKVVTWLRRTFAATYVVLAGRLAIEHR